MTNFKYEYSVRDGMTKYTAIIKEEGDGYVATCAELGTVSQGNTVDDALANLKEATELYLEEFPEKKDTKTLLKTFEVAGVVKT